MVCGPEQFCYVPPQNFAMCPRTILLCAPDHAVHSVFAINLSKQRLNSSLVINLHGNKFGRGWLGG